MRGHFALGTMFLIACSEEPRMQPLPPNPNGPEQPAVPAAPDLSGIVSPNIDLAPTAFSVASVSPATGSTTGGYQLTITGTGFDKNTRFSLDNIPLTDVQIVSDTQAKGFVAKSLGSFGKVALRATRGAGNDLVTKPDAFSFVPSVLQFRAKISLKTLMSNPFQLAIADFNGDGKMDLATDSNGSSVGVIFLNRTTGLVPAFSQPMYTPSIGGQIIGVAAHDFNNDGKQDLIYSRHNSQVLNYLWGNGDGTFVIAQQLGYGGYYHGYHFAIGDLNNDGKMDAVTSSAYSNCTVHGFTNDGNGNFTTRQSMSILCHTESTFLGDFDGDNKLDVVMPYISSSYMTSIYRGNGDGTFNGTRYDFNSGSGSFYAAVGDLNKDGKPDLVIANHNNSNAHTISVLINTSSGAGNIAFAAPVRYNVGINPFGTHLADLNGDGNLDSITGNYDNNTATVYLGKGDGTLGDRLEMPVGGYPRGIGVADFNGDKKPDLAFVEHSNRLNSDSYGISVLINDAQ
jgi:hypothetical protein